MKIKISINIISKMALALNNQCTGIFKKGARKGSRCLKNSTGSSTYCSYHKSANKRIPQPIQLPNSRGFCQICRNNLDKNLSTIRMACSHSYHYKCFMIMCEDSHGFIFNANKCLTCNYDLKDEMTTDCCICLDSLITDIHKTPCNHLFHKACLDQWDKANGCPCCRQQY